MADLTHQLADLQKSLEEFDTSQDAPSSIAPIFNALLEQAKAQKPGDPVVAAIEPVSASSGSELADITAGALRTVTQQLLTALG